MFVVIQLVIWFKGLDDFLENFLTYDALEKFLGSLMGRIFNLGSRRLPKKLPNRKYLS